MSDGAAALALFAVLGILIALRVPVAFALGAAAFAYFAAAGHSLLSVAQKIAAQMAEPTLAAIPLFILCGELLSGGGMARRLVDVAALLVGFLRGGLAVVNIVASMLFGGLSGSSVADVASLGPVLIPRMAERGYRRDFSTALTVASSTQGIILPPSHNAILVSLAAGGTISVRALFLGGYVPGLLIAVSLSVVALWTARRSGLPRERPVPAAEALRTVVGALPALATPFIILVPIVLGRVPAHLAAALAVAWALAASMLVYRSLAFRDLPGILLRAGRTSGLVLILIGTAAAFAEALTRLHVPASLAAWLAGWAGHPVVLLLLMNVAVLLLGAVMDMAPLIVILTPILLPVWVSLGLDPVHFGIVLLLNLAIGLCTPPVGATLFVGCAVGEVPIEKTVRALLPFYVAMIAALLLVTFVPALTLWLPARF